MRKKSTNIFNRNIGNKRKSLRDKITRKGKSAFGYYKAKKGNFKLTSDNQYSSGGHIREIIVSQQPYERKCRPDGMRPNMNLYCRLFVVRRHKRH